MEHPPLRVVHPLAHVPHQLPHVVHQLAGWRIGGQGEGLFVDIGKVITDVAEDVMAGRSAGEISSVFHRTMVELVVAGCSKLRDRSGVSSVALSGGTFQNMLLLNRAVELLEQHDFIVYRHHRVPANDGGLSLGQAVLANRAQ